MRRARRRLSQASLRNGVRGDVRQKGSGRKEMECPQGRCRGIRSRPDGFQGHLRLAVSTLDLAQRGVRPEDRAAWPAGCGRCQHSKGWSRGGRERYGGLLKKSPLELGFQSSGIRPVIPLLDVSPKDTKSGCGANMCPAALVVGTLPVTKTCNRPKCPSADD